LIELLPTDSSLVHFPSLGISDLIPMMRPSACGTIAMHSAARIGSFICASNNFGALRAGPNSSPKTRCKRNNCANDIRSQRPRIRPTWICRKLIDVIQNEPDIRDGIGDLTRRIRLVSRITPHIGIEIEVIKAP
jgi:hypothetical protein